MASFSRSLSLKPYSCGRLAMCLVLIFSTIPINSSRLVVKAQGGNPGGLRTTGAPSKNLPNLDAVRSRKEVDKKMEAPKPANRCRHWDKKCKETKEKRSLYPQSVEENSFRGLIAQNRSMSPFAWQFDAVPSFVNFLAAGDRPAPDAALAPPASLKETESPTQKKLPHAFASSLFPAAAAVQYANLETARVQPHYRTGKPGEDLLSGNFHWSMPIISLPGRGGHDLNLTLSYNSLVWTKSGGVIRFDMDYGWPSPGFRLGFPVFYGPYVNSRTNRQSYLLITPAGAAVELRQVSGVETYESEDGSFMRFKYNSSTGAYILTTADGTQYVYGATLDIIDRNGNKIVVTYNTDGLMDTITDTVGRVLNFDYGLYNALQAINQSWNGIQRTIASFSHADQMISYNFSGVTPDNLPNNQPITVMSQLDLMGGTRYTFQYNTYGQVTKVERYGGNTFLRAWTSYNLPATAMAGAQTDCPRFTTRTDWAYEWSAPAGVVTNFQFLQNIANPDAATETSIPTLLYGHATTPDGTKYRELYYPDPTGSAKWRYGLLKMSQTFTNNDTINRKEVKFRYEQPCGLGSADNWLYPCNPRVTETNIYDNTDTNNSTWENRRRTTISYRFGTPNFNLPEDVYEYDSNATTVLRRTHTDYNLSSTYTNRRIIGLPSARMLYDGADVLFSKVEFVYDEAAQFLTHSPTPINLDTSIPSNARGNLTTTRRFNVNDNTSVENKIAYYHTGNVAYSKDALNHQTTFGYNNGTMFINSSIDDTYGYPTTITDPDNYSSTIQYDYNNGSVAKTTDPKGASVLRLYDVYDRLYQVTNLVNGAYTRYEFDSNQYFIKSYSTIQDNAGEFYSISVFDGHDRLRATVSEHPGSVGQYKGVYNGYDTMGRLSLWSNPTEINSAWDPVGDDSPNTNPNGGWRYSQQTYDWNGRPEVSTDTLAKSRSASYNGCGCAGGLSVTHTDEMGRKRTEITDILGRKWKSQILKPDNTVYSTVTYTYNVRDQITNIAEKDEAANLTQNTVMTYDGHGRLQSRKRPQEDSATTFDYYADDMLWHSKDARNAEGTLSYNARHLLTSATYVTPGNVAATNSVIFQYNEIGQRESMDDGPGYVSYHYNTLGQLDGETRTFDGITGKTFSFSYGYNLGGQVLSMTYSATGAASDTINYGRDKAGQITGITGSPYAGVTNYATGIQYRAWGAPKAVSYGSGFSASAKYDVRMQVSEFDIPGVIGGTYTYNDDHQLSAFAAATTTQPTQYDRRMDRTFGYDQFGRLNSSVANNSGFKAIYNPQQDAFGNVTNATYHYWQNGTSSVTFNASYQNNRATSIVDADQIQNWGYDAMGNRTSISKVVNNVPTLIESIPVDALGRGATSTFDGDGRSAFYAGNYYVRSTVFGGEIITTVDYQGVKTSGLVLDGSRIIAEQIRFPDGTTRVRWLHRDPLNLVARDTEPGQVKLKVRAVTPNGAQIQTSEEVNLNQYYACLLGGNNNPTCTGYNPQSASAYGYLANQANSSAGAGLKVDGALTLWTLNDLAQQLQRTGHGIFHSSPALAGSPLGPGGFVSVWKDGYYDDRPHPEDDPNSINIHTDYVEGHFEFQFVPGGEQQRPPKGTIWVNLVTEDKPIKNTVTDAYNILKSTSERGKKCREVIGQDSAALLDYLYKKGQISLTDLSGAMSDLASSEAHYGATLFQGKLALISLDTFYFGNKSAVPRTWGVGDGKNVTLSARDSRLLILLHELSHATGEVVHGNGWLPGKRTLGYDDHFAEIINNCIQNEYRTKDLIYLK